MSRTAYETVVEQLRGLDAAAADTFADRYWDALDVERQPAQPYESTAETGIAAVMDEQYDGGTWFDIGVAAEDLGTRLQHCDSGEEMADAVEAYVASVETEAYRDAVDAVVTGVFPAFL